MRFVDEVEADLFELVTGSRMGEVVNEADVVAVSPLVPFGLCSVARGAGEDEEEAKEEDCDDLCVVGIEGVAVPIESSTVC